MLSVSLKLGEKANKGILVKALPNQYITSS